MDNLIDWCEYLEFSNWWARVTNSYMDPPLDQPVPNTGGEFWRFEDNNNNKLIRVQLYNPGFSLEVNGIHLYPVAEVIKNK